MKIQLFQRGKDIIDAMNQRYYGFISWFNHGSPCGLASMNKRYDSGEITAIL